MEVGEAFIPVSLVAGLFFLLTPWLDPTSSRVRTTALVFILCLQAVYMWWRITQTLPPLSRVGPYLFSVGYLGIELLLTWTALRFLRGIRHHRERSAEADSQAGWFEAGDRAPLIDVLIPTYNEAWPILEKTVIGALAQSYPRFRVWVLDDGRRVRVCSHCGKAIEVTA